MPRCPRIGISRPTERVAGIPGFWRVDVGHEIEPWRSEGGSVRAVWAHGLRGRLPTFGAGPRRKGLSEPARGQDSHDAHSSTYLGASVAAPAAAVAASPTGSATRSAPARTVRSPGVGAATIGTAPSVSEIPAAHVVPGRSVDGSHLGSPSRIPSIRVLRGADGARSRRGGGVTRYHGDSGGSRSDQRREDQHSR